MSDPGPVVVLGGSGFAGRHIGSAFARTGCEVVSVSRNPVRDGHTRCVPMDLSAEDPSGLTDLLMSVRPRVIVNAVGAVWTTSESAMLAVNATLVAHIVDVVERLPYRATLIHLGSVYEYAPTLVGRSIDAHTPQCPVDVYGWTKLLGSSTVLQASAAGKIDGVVLRPSTLIGAGMPYGSLLGGVADRLARARPGGRAVLRFGALEGERDFLDVRDVATAVVAASSRPVIGQGINLGRGQAVSVRTLVETLIAISGVSVVIEETGQQWTARKRNPGRDWLQVDITAAGRALGWRPRESLAGSLRALWHERTSPGAHGPTAAEGSHEPPSSST